MLTKRDRARKPVRG